MMDVTVLRKYPGAELAILCAGTSPTVMHVFLWAATRLEIHQLRS
jgi:hypothetical protein